jgi:hypothetical protein
MVNADGQRCSRLLIATSMHHRSLHQKYYDFYPDFILESWFRSVIITDPEILSHISFGDPAVLIYGNAAPLVSRKRFSHQ